MRWPAQVSCMCQHLDSRLPLAIKIERFVTLHLAEAVVAVNDRYLHRITSLN
jgi:hypothetical protein